MELSLNYDGSSPDTEFVLYQNSPNPFSGESAIGFDLPEAGDATLSIYDVTGKVMKRFAGHFAKGYNEIRVNSDELVASGVLYYELVSADQRATKKMVILK